MRGGAALEQKDPAVVGFRTGVDAGSLIVHSLPTGRGGAFRELTLTSLAEWMLRNRGMTLASNAGQKKQLCGSTVPSFKLTCSTKTAILVMWDGLHAERLPANVDGAIVRTQELPRGLGSMVDP